MNKKDNEKVDIYLNALYSRRFIGHNRSRVFTTSLNNLKNPLLNHIVKTDVEHAYYVIKDKYKPKIELRYDIINDMVYIDYEKIDPLLKEVPELIKSMCIDFIKEYKGESYIVPEYYDINRIIKWIETKYSMLDVMARNYKGVIVVISSGSYDEYVELNPLLRDNLEQELSYVVQFLYMMSITGLIK